MITIGIIKYINSVPLSYGLEHYGELIFDTPHHLARRFFEEELDVAFVPSVEYLKHRDEYHMIEGVSISSFGKTNSVFLAYEGAIEDLRVVRLSAESATSNFVVREILSKRYGIEPRFIAAYAKEPCDGEIIIGDEALKVAADKDDADQHIDVGQAWYELTGLPIVYAVCVTRVPELAGEFAEIFAEIKERNLALLGRVLEDKGLTEYYEYIRGLDYDLTSEHLQALEVLNEWVAV